MKFIKLGVISFFILFLILTSIGLLLPSTVQVTRNINIGAPSGVLYSYIINMNNWHLWMEGVDSATIKIMPSNDERTTVATINKQQIQMIKATTNEIVTLWKNNHGNNQFGVFQLMFDSTTNTTNLNWYFEQKNSWYPWERLSSLANEKVIGPFMEHSLDKLKKITEQNKN